MLDEKGAPSMPELPEIETYRTLLTKKIGGKPIDSVVINREKSINVPAKQFAQYTIGRTLVSIERRAKHLLFQLDNGFTLLLHLMLGGWMYYGTDEMKPDRSTQVELFFGGEKLYFIGLRLGYLHLMTAEEADQRLAQLGPEPLDPRFTDDQFKQLMSSKRGILKPTMVDQKVLSGIGNCYSDEICFHAGILPMRKANDLSETEMSRLFHSMKFVLTEALRYGGYMEYPLYEGDTLTGGYNERCKVYDEGGKPCKRCGHEIIKGEIASRKTFYCGNCQQ
jgi:formamidopyrimidine-DNA glycosylase